MSGKLTRIGDVPLANGRTLESSGEFTLDREEGGTLLLTIRKHHSVQLRLPPSLARSLGELLIKGAGPKKPKLAVVKKGGGA